MSQIDFVSLEREYPKLRDAWQALATWFKDNIRKRYVEINTLVKKFPGINPVKFVVALEVMVEEQILVRKYRVKTTDGYYLEGEFDTPTEVPEELPDREFSKYVRTDEAEIVSGYSWKRELSYVA